MGFPLATRSGSHISAGKSRPAKADPHRPKPNIPRARSTVPAEPTTAPSATRALKARGAGSQRNNHVSGLRVVSSGSLSEG